MFVFNQPKKCFDKGNKTIYDLIMMKKLLSISFVFLLMSGNVYAASMISIQDYIKSNSDYLNDPITKTYILKRCAAGYLYAAGITKDKEPKSSELFANAFNKVMIFAGDILISEMKWTAEVAAKSLETDIDNMWKYYEKDGNDSFARTGNYMMGNYIGEDIQFCKGVVESIK
jgi:hypothetical protein